MKQVSRALIVISCVVFAVSGWAQETTKDAPEAKKPDTTVEQVLEKFVAATGGRAAYEKIATMVSKGTLEIVGQGITGTIEIYAKAPNKLLLVQSITGIGEVKQGTDGQVVWSQDPFQGIRELEGVELANFKRRATFNADLKWRELYEKVELVGTEKVEDRDTYVIRLTPSVGKPITRSYDAQTFLLLREASVYEGAQGTMPGEEYPSDYRDVNGVKVAFQSRAKLPVGEVLVKLTEVKTNVEIDDAKFAKPAAAGK
ncbi:MAG: DUF620 domain-containing protein [Acidobacteria bacterium]|nr:DUF620 domain-containing protein [Acidobacteriota bacterium]